MITLLTIVLIALAVAALSTRYGTDSRSHHRANW
jgi:hypothetical protein